MELKVKIADLNKPNLNNIVYTEECFNSIQQQIVEKILPVKLITDDFWKDVELVGSAKLDALSVYPELHFTVNIVDPCVKELVKNGWGGFGLCGMSKQVIQDHTNVGEDIKVVSDLNLTSVGYTLTPACSTKYEVVKDE